MLTHLDLFSGIGGISLAAERAGFITVGFCEIADYPFMLLEKYWPDVPKWRDIQTLTGASFYEKTGLRTVDLISGGFPCQPFSVAGNQKGEKDDRYLWPEMLRVIREIRPRWVLGENVPGILPIAGYTVCQDLEREGYSIGIFDYEAAAVGAPHRRERVFFVANRDGDSGDARRAEPAGQLRKAGPANGGEVMADANSGRCDSSHICGGSSWESEVVSDGAIVADAEGEQNRRIFQPGFQPDALSSGVDVADAHCEGLQVAGHESGVEKAAQGHGIEHSGSAVPDADSGSGPVRREREFSAANEIEGIRGDNGSGTPEYESGEWWFVEPDVGRVAHGISARVDRLKCLGNAVVPAQIYPILKAIYEVEQEGINAI